MDSSPIAPSGSITTPRRSIIGSSSGALGGAFTSPEKRSTNDAELLETPRARKH